MPLLLGPNSVDTVSVNGPCTYEAAPLTAITTSPNVFIGGQALQYIPVGATDTVSGVPSQPLVPCPVPETVRTLSATVNSTVFINRVLPGVQGETTELAAISGSPRVIVGPFQHPTVVFNTKNV